mmetsp:Transcript_41825/g.81994  ORF Transcript_41825/g.81994 Transcript_41825/m.81994 type:complete len:80 (-) Transcript_41825:392-631(-)
MNTKKMNGSKWSIRACLFPDFFNPLEESSNRLNTGSDRHSGHEHGRKEVLFMCKLMESHCSMALFGCCYLQEVLTAAVL